MLAVTSSWSTFVLKFPDKRPDLIALTKGAMDLEAGVWNCVRLRGRWQALVRGEGRELGGRVALVMLHFDMIPKSAHGLFDQ